MMLLNLLLVPIGAVLWYLGGYGYGDDGIPDEGLPAIGKAFRRIVWPIVAGAVCVLNNVPWVQSIGVAIGLGIVNSLGYGESTRWWQRVVVGLSLGVPACLLSARLAWPIVAALTFIPLYRLSLRYNWMNWSVVEAAMGAIQAASILAALLSR
jgi:hypothetical protein